MGRKKPLPGPLALNEQTARVGASTGNWSTTASGQGHSNSSHSVRSGTHMQHQHQAPALLPTPAASAPASASSITSSLSPRSPRSPYTSKFSPNRDLGAGKPNQVQAQQLNLQQVEATTPQQCRATGISQPQETNSQQVQVRVRVQVPSTLSTSSNNHHQKSSYTTANSPLPTHIADLQQQLPPLTRAVTSSSTTYSSHQQHQEHSNQFERRLKTSHGLRGEHHDGGDDSDFSALNSHNHSHKHKHSRSISRGIKAGFHFNFGSKPAKSSDRLPPKTSPSQPVVTAADSTRAASAGPRQQEDPGAGVVARGASMNGSRRSPATAAAAAATAAAVASTSTTKQSLKQSDTSHVSTPSLHSKSETSLADGHPNANPTQAHGQQQPPLTKKEKAPKPKPFTLLSRTKSHREKEARTPRHTPSPQESREPRTAVPTPRHPPHHNHRGPNPAAAPPQSAMELERPEKTYVTQPPKTAAVPGHDRAYREVMPSSSRNHSSDRAPPSRDASSDRRGHQDRDYSRSHQSNSRDGNGASSFFNNLRREGGRVAESIGKGLFGKGGRSGSTSEREPVDDEHYVLKVINLPLVDQTRLTRISKRLEESRDKTEFWMPAFPWRAIDYLNYKGCDVEGLYRVPGSGPQIKKWQRRFDEQYDVDLFTQEDLYDINIIGSMLKAWLRELPDELFPKEAQDRIARECMGAEKVPQLLIDELSNLSPFNYYLLFAITCHLSLLLAHSDKNKMDFRNLCICFQPCMKIDAFCFKFLVCDWRDCWKGCKTEARYIEEEYKLFDQPPPPGLGVRKKLEPRVEPRAERRPSPALVDRELDRERNVSSSDSNSKRSQLRGDDQGKLLKQRSPPPVENGKESGSSRSASAQGDQPPHQMLDVASRDSSDIRPLSPIKPLSPLGF